MVTQEVVEISGPSSLSLSPREEFHVVKSENDKRLYRYIKLSNDIKILLISDDTSEKCAASVDVHIGKFVDPDEVSGIAHFCEHMLFLGTEKYPVENGFCQYLSQHGGLSNAYTSDEHTNYHFDVKADALEGAIDRFAQFFLSPLFDADSTDRELNAIDSEYQKNILIDSRRVNFIDCRTSREGHPCQKFGTGNIETLKTIPEQKNIDIRKLLLDFHNKYYSSNIMCVAVLGKESLDELEAIVRPLFSNVKNKNVILPVYEEHPYGESELKTMIQIATVKEMKVLKMKFPFPDLRKHYNRKPSSYITHLIGHKSEGSLFFLLKSKTWVNELCARYLIGANGYAFFVISMELSEKGMDHINDILVIVFQYLNLIKAESPNEYIFQEMKMLKEMRFRFKDKEPQTSYVTTLSKSMQHYPAEDVLYGPYRIDSLDAELITGMLSYLRPDNFRCFALSQNFKGKTDRTVQYYDAEFTLQKIPDEQIKALENAGLHSGLHLPKRNLFMPDNMDIKVPRTVDEVKGVPTIIKDTNTIRGWYKADDTFFLPKSSIHLTISCPLSQISPYHSNQLNLVISLLKDELTEFSYDAGLAGISYAVNASSSGIFVYIFGYNDKQILLLTEILKRLKTLPIKTDRFVIAKQKGKYCEIQVDCNS